MLIVGDEDKKCVTAQKLVASMDWIPAFVGMTNLGKRTLEVIPAKAGIQLQGNLEAVPDPLEVVMGQ